MKKCPFCAEDIQDKAIICRYCGREISSRLLSTSYVKSEMPVREPYLDRDFLLAFHHATCASIYKHHEELTSRDFRIWNTIVFGVVLVIHILLLALLIQSSTKYIFAVYICSGGLVLTISLLLVSFSRLMNARSLTQIQRELKLDEDRLTSIEVAVTNLQHLPICNAYSEIGQTCFSIN